ncbi:preprotein translocase subunit SecA [Aureivirga sp. CE67]|uniref:preprotein translocase subunit SecA n=1 Tax=Aureivirga sp. CE67 TaxID=1788983 RepID=UPI0018CB7B1D|nr:preprotein translocase subunit SecA [Aureivirga sp. CE67]
MSLINTILKAFVGDKKTKDLKALQPIVDKVLAYEKNLINISNDELRAKTLEFKKQIEEAINPFEMDIVKLEQESESADIDRKEEIYSEIDKLKDASYEASEGVLGEILPAAFAVLKETGRRFTNAEKVEVTASPFDRELSAVNDHVNLEGDKAIWNNSWDAAGSIVTWGMIHYDVQLIGGSVLHQGKIAEMMTGEGKTLVATLAIYLNALTGRGVHVVTVNDYLAKRDSAWMAPIFEFHGLSIDCIDKHQPNSEARRNAYNCDIVYGTNNEFGFDYLRDNMTKNPEELVQREHNYAIIDEVDSVLVDDARTPLIISGPTPMGDRHEFNELKPVIENIVNKQKQYLTGVFSEAKKKIKEGDSKEGAFLLYRTFRGLPKNKALIKFLSLEGMRQLLQKTENFYMQDNNREMPKIDKELYFTIDEKSNSIDLTDKGVEYLSGMSNDKDFFILPNLGLEVGAIDKLDISEEEKVTKKEELYRNFSAKSERIHSLNQLLKAYTLFEKNKEYIIDNDKVMIVDEQTGRAMEGRRFSDGLHQALEAKENVKIEAATQTYATVTLQNYFRMYRKLSGMTGTAITEAGEFWEIYKLDVVEIPTNRPIARNDKQDLVYKTTREKYNAVIEEIDRLVKQNRPVLVGTTSVEISELLSRMLTLRKIPHNVLNAKLHKKEADIVEEAGKSGVVTIATNMAGRGTDIKLSDEVKAAGGLAIIGTERHDSRRVDRQLRGRAGRQGDVGSSQFYVSLEDNLMRLFGSDRIAKMMDRMGHKDGEVIQHSMISKSIERAQKKVEENNFGVRKNLIEYDDVMNSQREVVYKRRRHALYGERLQLDIVNMIYDTCDSLVNDSKASNNFETFELELIRITSMVSPISKEEFEKGNNQDLIDKLYKAVYKHYTDKMERAAATAFPVISHVYETQADRFERIVVPFTDGIKKLDVVTNLKEAYESNGKKLIQDFEKNISLAIIDDAWKDHLRQMDELKQTVRNAQYEQKDPLLIYKFESFELFRGMLDKVNKDVLSFLFKGELPAPNPDQVSQAKEQAPEKVEVTKEEYQSPTQAQSAPPVTNQTQEPEPQEPIVRSEKKIGRNEKVTIKNVQTGENKEVKYKQAIPLIEAGTWVVVDNE